MAQNFAIRMQRNAYEIKVAQQDREIDPTTFHTKLISNFTASLTFSGTKQTTFSGTKQTTFSVDYELKQESAGTSVY